MFATPALMMQSVKEGKLRALVTTAPQRSPLAPDVPTLTEAGLPPLGISSWGGILGPAGIPQPIIERLSREINAVLAQPTVRAQMEGLGFLPSGSSPEELGRIVRQQAEVWRGAVRDAKITQE